MNQKADRKPYSLQLQLQHQSTLTNPFLKRQVDPKFIQKIQSQDHPSQDYKNKLRGLYSEELQKGLYQLDARKSFQGLQNQSNKKQYRQKLNGILSQLEKNQSKRKVYYQNCVNRQQKNRGRFVDDDMIKTSKLNQYTQKHYDKDYFYHGDDIYKQHQKYLSYQRNMILKMQTTFKERELFIDKQNKKLEEYQRKNYEQELNNYHKQDIQRKRQNQSLYFQDLTKIVQQKKCPKPIESTPKPLRHNPITNPIQFHIDNPYLLKKMQSKYGDSKV